MTHPPHHSGLGPSRFESPVRIATGSGRFDSVRAGSGRFGAGSGRFGPVRFGPIRGGTLKSKGFVKLAAVREKSRFGGSNRIARFGARFGGSVHYENKKNKKNKTLNTKKQTRKCWR